MDPTRKLLTIKNLVSEEEYKKALASLQLTTEAISGLVNFVTEDPELLQVKDQLSILSEVDDCVLIRGETGTGKDLAAKILHGKKPGRFIAINCSAISPNLVESELFGHKKGSFTGALDNHQGLFAAAREGTVFLDEIGDMPRDIQTKVLRAIENRTIRAVGSTTDERITARIVAGTHQPLEELMVDDKFRVDLFYRLSTFQIKLKPLRLRPRVDFELLVKKYGGGDENITEFLWTHKEHLLGNVRQLKAIIRRYTVLKTLSI